MANVLSKDKQITIISALAEGSSMRAISRMTSVHQDTICLLQIPPATTPLRAVQVAIAGMFREQADAES
jgi:hypothetical protein